MYEITKRRPIEGGVALVRLGDSPGHWGSGRASPGNLKPIHWMGFCRPRPAVPFEPPQPYW